MDLLPTDFSPNFCFQQLNFFPLTEMEILCKALVENMTTPDLWRCLLTVRKPSGSLTLADPVITHINKVGHFLVFFRY